MARKAEIAAELRDEIRAGRYGPGDRLPRVPTCGPVRGDHRDRGVRGTDPG